MELTSASGSTPFSTVSGHRPRWTERGLCAVGGTIVEIGVPGPTVPVTVPLRRFRSGKRLIGCVYGGSSVFHDIPRYVALAESGAMDLGALLGRRVALVDVPDILAGHLGAGRTVIIP